MIKTLNPYPNLAKTAEIMSRYRPIAPKPETSNNNSTSDGSSNSSNSLSQKIKNSPYLRNLWPQLQARPTRTRKRGRAPISLPSSLKRPKTSSTHVLGFCQPLHVTSPSKNLSLQGFAPPLSLPQLHLPNHAIGVLNCNNLERNSTNNHSLVTLSLLPCSPNSSPQNNNNAPKFDIEVIDLNNKNGMKIPQERDLLQQLQKPASSTNNIVVTPQPIRPIGSCISVGCINEDTNSQCVTKQTPKKAEELEQEVESEKLPAVISDSNNKIRMVNSAYKEMVGQPECSWLESMILNNSDGSTSCKQRISGEVTLNLCSNIPISSFSNGFCCWVRIEWESHEHKKNYVNAFCDVVKLCCDQSRDYVFTWRFHTRTTREASQSSCCNA